MFLGSRGYFYGVEYICLFNNSFLTVISRNQDKCFRQLKGGRLGTLSRCCNTSTHSWTSVPSLPLAVSHEHQLGVMQDRNKGRCTLLRGAFFPPPLSTSARVAGVRSKYSGRNSSSVFRELRDKKWKKQGGEVFWVITPSFCIAAREGGGGGAFFPSHSLSLFFIYIFFCSGRFHSLLSMESILCTFCRQGSSGRK